MRKSILAALLALGTLVAAATTGAGGANALEPTLSFGTSFGGTSVNHFTTVPSGALFDGDIVTLTPGINAGIIGILADATPLDNTCATGTFVFETKAGAKENVPVGTSCGLPFPYLAIAAKRSGDYAEVCAVVEVAARQPGAPVQRTENCFRFPNDATVAAPPLIPPFNFNAQILGFDFKHTNQFPAGVTFDGATWAVNPEWNILTIGWLADMAPFIDAHCAEGSVVFETKSGEQEVHPLSRACSNGYLYGLLSAKPAKEYRAVCMSSATVGDGGQRACFRFIN
ncbi:hypothetical protein [Nocardia sp. NPDC051832]|uniref:hypothetical protein n=1 Tax=Nocardia sp. NPDC051832 TaxID=3155673 RepID=UPI00341FEBC5